MESDSDEINVWAEPMSASGGKLCGPSGGRGGAVLLPGGADVLGQGWQPTFQLFPVARHFL